MNLFILIDLIYIIILYYTILDVMANFILDQTLVQY